MKIVTSGARYLDIDAYAGCVAYAELLQKQGMEAEAVSNAPWNVSVSKTVRSWDAPLTTIYTPSDEDTFTLIDVSDPTRFDAFVDLDRVDTVIDHHPGFDSYWQDNIGDGAHIEFIGAACTQVYELWKAAGKLDEMSALSAKLLVCGILDNTLNFIAKVSTDRDRVAYDDLLQRAGLPKGWTAIYFRECQEAILEDAVAAIKDDTKNLLFKTFTDPILTGQLVVWEGQKVLEQYKEVLEKTQAEIDPVWFMNLVSIEEGRSYFVTTNVAVQEWLAELLDLEFIGSVAAAQRPWLRKEILKQDINAAMK